MDRGNPVLSQDVVKLLKTQDAGYLKTMILKTRRAREKLEHEFILREGKGAELLGDGTSQRDQQHIVFIASKDEQKRFDPEDYFATTTDGVGRHFNRPRVRHYDSHKEGEKQDATLLSMETRDDWKTRRHAEREAVALKEARVSRRQYKREQEAQRSHLKALKVREKNVMAAEQELELQRAKMNNSAGGMTKAGVSWKVRERKR